jgi:murein L,D-transpeptidase YcbB/YkuD
MYCNSQGGKRAFIGLILFFIVQPTTGQVFQEELRLTLEKSTQESPAMLRGSHLLKLGETYQFYAHRNFDPIWSAEGRLTELAYEFRFELRQSLYDGLQPATYHLALIDSYVATVEKREAAKEGLVPKELAELELLMTDAFFALAEDLDLGLVNPERLAAKWSIPRKCKALEYDSLLTQAWRTAELRSQLALLYPKTPSYSKGKLLLRQLEERTKGKEINWKPIKTDRVLRPGESNAFLLQVRERLAFWGYLEALGRTDAKVYDSLLVRQVLAFQAEKGIKADGILGYATLQALNESPAQLMDKIKVNLERMRWIPEHFFKGEAILVNVPSFELVYHKGADTLFTTKVIVGTIKHQTPVFTAPLSYLVFSPYWNIPPSIAKNETLPAIRKNANYLERNNMEVVNTAGQPLSLSQVNWNAKPFPYLIRQKPGESNALGQVKFMFPNPNNVYLHDTPAKQLFDQDLRAFSHGCIRMAQPRDFAELLLKNSEGWTSEKVGLAMGQDKEKIVNLPYKIPVGIVYFTFWTEANGKPRFFVDIYKRDAEVLELLRR